MSKMKIACLCPTFGRPRLVRNALACFLAQDYPAESRRLLIFDDAGQIDPQRGDCWEVFTAIYKSWTLPAKYAFLMEQANEWGADAYCVWDDDDIYLPWHLTAHAEAMAAAGWSHPERVYSLYTGKLKIELVGGRFHGALAMRRDYAERVGGWGDSPRCDYDQQLMGRLKVIGPPGRPDANRPPSYVYRWGSTGADHCSSRCRGPDDETWYTDTPITEPGKIELLTPLMDEETNAVIHLLLHTQ